MLSARGRASAWVSLVDPVQVFEDHDDRLIQALPNDDALDGVERRAGA